MKRVHFPRKISESCIDTSSSEEINESKELAKPCCSSKLYQRSGFSTKFAGLKDADCLGVLSKTSKVVLSDFYITLLHSHSQLGVAVSPLKFRYSSEMGLSVKLG